MKVVNMSVDDEHIAALTILVGGRVADSDPSVVVEIEEKPGAQVEGLRQRQFSEIIIVNVILILIIDRPEK